MFKVLITRQIPKKAREILSHSCEVVENQTAHALSRRELIAATQAYDGILCMLNDRFDHEVLSHSTRLKILSNYAVGLDNIDLITAKEREIKVFNLPDIVTNSSADMTLALLLSYMRKIPQASAFVKEGSWKEFDPSLFCGEELRGKVFGILGYGRIGLAVAQRVLPFGPKVIAYKRSPLREEESLGGAVSLRSLEQLFEESDYLSIHLPLTGETRGMIDLSAISKMKKKPLLINMARGPIVKTADLIKALKEGMLRGAILDVTDPEPLPGSHPLCELPNCLITPHIGTATVECRTQMAIEAAKNLLEGFSRFSV